MVVTHVARITDKEGTRLLTEAEYNDLDLSGYAWAIDGCAEPPTVHRGEENGTLVAADFDALAKMIRARGERFTAQALFGAASSDESAVRCAYRATAEVEPNHPRRGGSFPTRGSAKDNSLCFVFSPAPTVNWCLVERLDPTESEPVSSPFEDVLGSRSQWAQPIPFADAFRLASLALPDKVLERVTAPDRPTLKVSPKRTTEEGISVLVRSFRVLRRSVRAHVTVTNATAKPKVIGSFTLHVGGQVLRARPEESSHRRARGRKRLLKPETFVIDREATGVLVFPRPRAGGEAVVRARAVVG